MEETVLVNPRGRTFELEVPARHAQRYTEHAFEGMSTSTFERAAALSDVVIDIGSHIGWYALAAASANPRARVIAVEGGPEMAEVCRRNCERVAPGRVELLGFDIIERAGVGGPELGVPPGRHLLMRVDVGGHEIAVLDVLADLLAEAAAVRLLIALNPERLDRAGSSPGALVDLLRAMGFAIHVLDDPRGRWRALPDWVPGAEVVPSKDHVNLLCVRGAEVIGAAFVLHSAGIGGAERTNLEEMDRLVSDGHLVHAYVPGEGAWLAARLVQVGVTVSRQPCPWWVGSSSGFDWRSSADGLEGLVSDLSTNRPDVVVTVTGVNPQGAIAAWLLGLPHVWSVHEFLDLDHGLTGPVPVAELGSFISRYADEVVVNSAAVGSHVLGPTGRYHVLPPVRGLLAADIEAAPAGLAGPPDTLGVFSALSPGKGQRDLIEAFGALVSEGRDLALRLFGEGSDEEVRTLRELVAGHELADRVTFEGAVADPLRTMAEVDIVVMPSRHEAFGRVPLEAILVGRPVVYCRGGGMDDYMVDGVTGVAAEPGDPADLARALRTVLVDSELRGRLVTRGRATLVEWMARVGDSPGLGPILIAAARRERPDSWASRAMGELVGAAASGAVRRQAELRDEVDALRHELDLVMRDREAVHADRMRIHRELEVASVQRDESTAALASIRATRRYRLTFGWRERIRQRS